MKRFELNLAIKSGMVLLFTSAAVESVQLSMWNNVDATEDPLARFFTSSWNKTALSESYTIDYSNMYIIVFIVLGVIGILALLCKWYVCGDLCLENEEGETEMLHPPPSRTASLPSRYLQNSQNRSTSLSSIYYNATLQDTNNDYFSRYGINPPNRNSVVSSNILDDSASSRRNVAAINISNVDASANIPSRNYTGPSFRADLSSNVISNSRRRIYNITMEDVGEDYFARYGINSPNRGSTGGLSSNNTGTTDRNSVRTSSENNIRAPSQSNTRAPSTVVILRDGFFTNYDTNGSFDESAWSAYNTSESSINNVVSSSTNDTREKPPEYSDVVIADLTGEQKFPEVTPQMSGASPPKYDAVKF